MKLVKVDWVDAYNAINKWQDLDEVREFLTDARFDATNIGWLVAEDKKAVVVCGRKGDGDEQYGLCERIPRGRITKITKLAQP